jgi:dienelactone hydrolase
VPRAITDRQADAMDGDVYDPFARGPFPVGVRVFRASDGERGRVFPAEVRYPARPGPHPLVLYSHCSGGHRRSATFLTTHLASHGYAVAALDHSEVFVPELAGRVGETAEQRMARIAAIVASRVPDLRFLLHHVLGELPDLELDADRIGLVGHSFGGWTVLAMAGIEPRVRAVVAHAPAGSTDPLPGVLPVRLTLDWDRDVPTLFLAGDNDVPIPPAAVRNVFDRTPATKRMATLRRADHQHFVDDVEGAHEAVRTMEVPPEAAWMVAATKPMTELCDGDTAHAFVRGLTLAHLDATLRADPAAARFLADDLGAVLAARAIDAEVAA